MLTPKTDDKKLEEVYADINKLMKHTKPHGNKIILGDLNAIVGEGREVGDFDLDKRNRKGE